MDEPTIIASKVSADWPGAGFRLCGCPRYTETKGAGCDDCGHSPVPHLPSGCDARVPAGAVTLGQAILAEEGAASARLDGETYALGVPDQDVYEWRRVPLGPDDDPDDYADPWAGVWTEVAGRG